MAWLGRGLIVAAIIGLILAESFWLRVLCGVLLGLYVVFLLVGYFTGEIDARYLAIFLLLSAFAWYVRGVKKNYGKY